MIWFRISSPIVTQHLKEKEEERNKSAVGNPKADFTQPTSNTAIPAQASSSALAAATAAAAAATAALSPADAQKTPRVSSAGGGGDSMRGGGNQIDPEASSPALILSVAVRSSRQQLATHRTMRK